MKLISTIGAAILFIIAALTIVFGFLFVLGATSPQGSSSWIIPGILMIGFGVLCVFGCDRDILFQAQSQTGGASAQKCFDQPRSTGQMKIDSIKCLTAVVFSHSDTYHRGWCSSCFLSLLRYNLSVD